MKAKTKRPEASVDELALAARIFNAAMQGLRDANLTIYSFQWEQATKPNRTGCIAIARALMPLLVNWDFSPSLPDDEITVLIASGDNVYMGHHEGAVWVTAEGGVIPDRDVQAWAHVPAVPALLPQPKGGAS